MSISDKLTSLRIGRTHQTDQLLVCRTASTFIFLYSQLDGMFGGEGIQKSLALNHTVFAH
jgi:hypothetical protein